MNIRNGFSFARELARKHALLLAGGMFAVGSTAAWATTCGDRCEVGYQAAVKFCRGDRGFLPDDLEDCLKQAQRDYEACLDDCPK